MRAIVVIPTYNERENIAPVVSQISALKLDLTLLFVDDGSPDGTEAEILRHQKLHPWIHLLQRGAKKGIGGAHLDGFRWAKQQGFPIVITMDCDLTHSPADIPLLLSKINDCEVAVGSRYLLPGSLDGWNWRRKLLTRTAHFLTRGLLGLPHDCTGAFRAYRMDRLSDKIFELIKSRSYSFFFESLFLLAANNARIEEVPISLPPRTYGSSKMPPDEPLRGVVQLLALAWERRIFPERFRIPSHKFELNSTVRDEGGWDDYWTASESGSNRVYQAVATFYRQAVITRRLTSVLGTTFEPGARLLHAGCGSGHVDLWNQRSFRLTGLDTSPAALQLYSQSVPLAEAICHGSILEIPFPDQSFDGAYHLGVIEHFNSRDTQILLEELRRVVKPHGSVVIFWPHRYATSVAVLRLWKKLAGRNARPLHPPEINLAKSRKWVAEVLAQAGFELVSYSFGWRDFWIQAEVIARPKAH